MYKFAASDTILDGVSNIYLISIATAFLAVIVAFYCSNFLKDESEKQLKQILEEVGEDEALEDDNEEYLPNDSTTESELENHYQQMHRRLVEEDDYDCNSDDDDDDEEEEDVIIRDNYMKHNDSSNNSDDEDYDDDASRVDGLVGKMKSNRVKELEAQLTRDQLEEERRIEREQLAAIFELLKKQEAELNMKEIDENELNAQLSLYR